MSVKLINNRLLRSLQNIQANCEKINEDLLNVAYSCTVLADVSTIDSIKIESDFIFESQDVKVIGVSPVANSFMKNVQNATGEYNILFQSYIYLLDHSIISTNKKNDSFNIIGIIDDVRFNLSNIDLILKINAGKENDTFEADVKCILININGFNYTLNCLGEKNILYNLQSAVSFFENNILVVNFDENITSEIIFDSGSSYKFIKKNTSGISTGAIVAIAVSFVIVLSIVIIIVILRKKLFRRKPSVTIESTILNLKSF